MKLKYYLRGMGIGIILTAVVMGFALGGRKATISDAEVIERAKALGMVDPTSGVLSSSSIGAETDEETTVASGEELDQTREEISQKINEELASYGESGSGLDEETAEGKEETKGASDEKSESTAGDSTAAEASKAEEDTAVAEEIKEENKNTEDTKKEEVKKEETKKEETKQEDAKSAETDTEEAKTQNTAATTDSSATGQNTGTAALGSKTSVTKTITIPGGLGSDQVAAILQREGIVDSAYSFNQYLCDNRMDRIIRSGTKTIPAGSTYPDIANIICK